MVDRVMALPEGTRLYLLAPIVRGRKGEYRKELADEKKRLKDEEDVRRVLNKFEPQDLDPGIAVPIVVSGIETDMSPEGGYRVQFVVQNLTDRVLSFRAIPYDQKATALSGGGKFKVSAGSKGQRFEIVVSVFQPQELRIFCGNFQTNRTLRW